MSSIVILVACIVGLFLIGRETEGMRRGLRRHTGDSSGGGGQWADFYGIDAKGASSPQESPGEAHFDSSSDDRDDRGFDQRQFDDPWGEPGPGFMESGDTPFDAHEPDWRESGDERVDLGMPCLPVPDCRLVSFDCDGALEHGLCAFHAAAVLSDQAAAAAAVEAFPVPGCAEAAFDCWGQLSDGQCAVHLHRTANAA
jgi:hypothetical protein